MGKIIHPPKDIRYPYPKAVENGNGHSTAKIIGRAKILEQFSEWGDYMRILDLVKWEHDDHTEIRFCQFYRKAGGTEDDWIFGQGAGHMKVETFYQLIRKAMNEPDYGTFEGIFEELCKLHP